MSNLINDPDDEETLEVLVEGEEAAVELDADGNPVVVETADADQAATGEEEAETAEQIKVRERADILSAAEASSEVRMKVLQDKIDAMEASERKRQEDEAAAVARWNVTSLEARITQHKEALKAARENGDTDGEIEAQDGLAETRAELVAAKNSAKAEVKVVAKKEEVADERQTTKKVENPVADAWVKRSPWFGSKEHAGATAYARIVDTELAASGLDTKSTKYFEELDKRMSMAYPDLVKPKAQVKQAVNVASAANSGASVKEGTKPTGKRVVKLTRADLANMSSFGLDPTDAKHQKRYAAELLAAENTTTSE